MLKQHVYRLATALLLVAAALPLTAGAVAASVDDSRVGFGAKQHVYWGAASGKCQPAARPAGTDATAIRITGSMSEFSSTGIWPMVMQICGLFSNSCTTGTATGNIWYADPSRPDVVMHDLVMQWVDSGLSIPWPERVMILRGEYEVPDTGETGTATWKVVISAWKTPEDHCRHTIAQLTDLTIEYVLVAD